MEVVPLVTLNISPQWVRRFQERHNWRDLKTNTSGNYLAYNDPKMIIARQRFHSVREQHNVPIELVLNFDQLWKASWVQFERLMIPSDGLQPKNKHVKAATTLKGKVVKKPELMQKRRDP